MVIFHVMLVYQRVIMDIESIIFTRYGIFIGYQWRLPSGKQPHNELENYHV